MIHLTRKKVQKKQIQTIETPHTPFNIRIQLTIYMYMYNQVTQSADLRIKNMGYMIKTYLLLFIYTKSILILTTNDDVINL